MEKKNLQAVANEESPVLPPAETPAPDSTKVVTVEVPNIAPVQVATASESMTLLQKVFIPQTPLLIHNLHIQNHRRNHPNFQNRHLQTLCKIAFYIYFCILLFHS